MAQKTKKMTIKYWESLSESSRKRALQYCYPIHPAIVEMLMNEKPDLKSEWWKMVFKKVRIPSPPVFRNGTRQIRILRFRRATAGRLTSSTRSSVPALSRVACR